ncbi:MAG: hypothetical protein ACLS4X_08555 [Ruminococcus callidus]
MKPETKVKDFSKTPPPPPLSGAAILKKVNRRGDVGIAPYFKKSPNIIKP